MAPIQQTIVNRNKKIVICVGIVAAGLWVMLAAYVLRESQKDHSTIHPGIVEVHSASPTGGGVPSATYMPHHATSLMRHGSAVSSSITIVPKAAMQSTSAAIRIHETSRAVMQSVGGGSAGAAHFSGSSSSPARGIQPTAYSGVIYIPLPTNAVTSVGANAAQDVVSQKMGLTQRRYTDDGSLPGYNDDPVPDIDEPETPVGDIAWPLMAVLTIVWCVRVRLRRRQACKTDK